MILIAEVKIDEQKFPDDSDDMRSNNLTVFTVEKKPVMLEAIDVLSILSKSKKAILRAKGDSIPNAVAIANIITEKMLKGNSKIDKICVDTEGVVGIGKMISTIEIVLMKN
jgi:archaea-specific DNA-binding protein